MLLTSKSLPYLSLISNVIPEQNKPFKKGVIFVAAEACTRKYLPPLRYGQKPLPRKQQQKSQKEKVPPTASGGPQPQLLSYIIHLARHCNRANLKALRETSPTAKRRRPGQRPEPCRFRVNVVTIG
jgi:hypothetical protein